MVKTSWTYNKYLFICTLYIYKYFNSYTKKNLRLRPTSLTRGLDPFYIVSKYRKLRLFGNIVLAIILLGLKKCWDPSLVLYHYFILVWGWSKVNITPQNRAENGLKKFAVTPDWLSFCPTIKTLFCVKNSFIFPLSAQRDLNISLIKNVTTLTLDRMLHVFHLFIYLVLITIWNLQLCC